MSTLEALDPSLVTMDLELLADKSGSMGSPIGFGSNPNQSRDAFLEEWITPVVGMLAALDADGIGIGFFSHSFVWQDGVTDNAAFSTYYKANQPMGGTNLGAALETRLNAFLDAKTADPTTKSRRIVIFTDGEASDGQRLRDCIVATCNRMQQLGLSDSDIAISFVQVGNDSGATAFLAQLDDNLNAPFDIVDVKPLTWLETHTVKDLLLAAEVD